MLEIINDLESFFKDNYRKIHVREYAKILKISPPTASKILENYFKEQLLKKEIDKQYYYYSANRDSYIFRDLQRIYWKEQLKELIRTIREDCLTPTIILFGSTAKAEIKKDSDIDITILTVSKINIDLDRFEKKLKKKIQLFHFNNIDEVSEELKHNILNGYILEGTL